MTLHRLPLCWMNLHTPNKRSVSYDGLNYVGKCSCCGEPIRRVAKSDWKKDWNPEVIFKLVA